MKPDTAIIEDRPLSRRFLIVTLLLMGATSGAMAQQSPSPVAAAAPKAAAGRGQGSTPSNNVPRGEPPALNPEKGVDLGRPPLSAPKDPKRFGTDPVPPQSPARD